jgi:hypothetical protein
MHELNSEHNFFSYSITRSFSFVALIEIRMLTFYGELEVIRMKSVVTYFRVISGQMPQFVFEKYSCAIFRVTMCHA